MKYGCIKSPVDLRNYRICKTAIKEDLPLEFKVEHSHIKNQCEVNSCVAHSVSEVLETFDNINYSTGWIYGYRPEDRYQGEGMTINAAIDTIYKIGCIENEVLPVNEEMKKAKEIVDNNLDEYKTIASKRKISSYAYLKTLEEVKQAIYTKKRPVIMSIDIDKEGLKLDKNYVAKVLKTPYGGHAVVCYGWNEIGLLIQNSWGEDWGDKGTFILPYEYPFDEAWLIEFNNETTIIEKPKYYWLRELIMFIIKILRNFKKE